MKRYKVGDLIKISSDIQKVKDLQRGHGEWTDNMKGVFTVLSDLSFITGVIKILQV